MTYQDYTRLRLGAHDCATLYDFIIEEGGSVPPPTYGDVVDVLTAIYNIKDTASLREICDLSRADFAREYGLNQRTLEGWESSSRSIPQPLFALLSYAVIMDTFYAEA